MIPLFKKCLILSVPIILLLMNSCRQYEIDSSTMQEYSNQLKANSSFQYPLDDYFPETPVTSADPPETDQGELHHTAEDSFAPAGTPVYAIGDGVVSYSGRAKGYGWLIIIDHPVENVYSLYGHLSPSQWKIEPGEVKKGQLIAYLAEAREGETMISHLHFGLRKGQRKDYPNYGDARWTAGYTKKRPVNRGWLEPSDIIGRTDTMKAWLRYIRKRDETDPLRMLFASDFKVTEGMYSDTEDLDQAIRTEFGENYRIADWNDILAFSKDIVTWADSIGLGLGESNSLMVSNDGYRIWLSRQYYISRFNSIRPKSTQFLSHDAIGDDFICLGSWRGIKRPILAIRK